MLLEMAYQRFAHASSKSARMVDKDDIAKLKEIEIAACLIVDFEQNICYDKRDKDTTTRHIQRNELKMREID